MKKIFDGIGLLVALFSIFFFLLVADKMVYMSNAPIYEFALEKYVPSTKLLKIAEEADVTIQLRNYKETSFACREMDITLINPDKTMKLGKKPSVFPHEKIMYYVLDKEDQRTVKYFTVQENDSEKISQFNSLMDKNNYVATVNQNNPVNFTMGMLFSPLNIGFFSVLAILLILCISTYCVYRIKEIGVLKLCGWGNSMISIRLLAGMILRVFGWSVFLIVPFSIYIMFSDLSKIGVFFKIYALVGLFLTFVFVCCSIVGVFFISHIDRVSAIKSKKNNRVLFGALLLFKIITTFLLVNTLNSTIHNISDLEATNNSITRLGNNHLYRISTASVPDEEVMGQIERGIGEIDDNKIYNYASPDNLIRVDRLKLYKKENKLPTSDNCAYTDMSFSMLEFIELYDEDGLRITAENLRTYSEVYLVPKHFENDLSDIMGYYGIQEANNVIFIEDGQVVDDVLFPGFYVYDSVFHLFDSKKVLYINNGEVLYNAEGKKQLMKQINALHLDEGSFTVEPLSADYNVLKSNLQLTICEYFFKVVINLVSYILCMVSICVIFMELRKKELAVYKLLGQKPLKTIAIFVSLNYFITIVAALYTNSIFIVLVLVEICLYQYLIEKYMKHKVILALKGE